MEARKRERLFQTHPACEWQGWSEHAASWAFLLSSSCLCFPTFQACFWNSYSPGHVLLQRDDTCSVDWVINGNTGSTARVWQHWSQLQLFSICDLKVRGGDERKKVGEQLHYFEGQSTGNSVFFLLLICLSRLSILLSLTERRKRWVSWTTDGTREFSSVGPRMRLRS